jgi:putative DNA methylase
VDLYLSCFGPALEAFSQHWPLVRGTPRQDIEQARRKAAGEIFEEEYDPYAVTPEDALEVARREVKDWRLNQLTHVQRNVELDNLTSWFVLAWDAFEAPASSRTTKPTAWPRCAALTWTEMWLASWLRRRVLTW